MSYSITMWFSVNSRIPVGTVLAYTLVPKPYELIACGEKSADW